jgi:hypothetical protein
VVRLLLCLGLASLVWAAEVSLDLPEQIVPNAVLDGAVKIFEPGSSVTAVDLPDVPGLTWQLSNRNSKTSINGAVTVSVGIVLRAAALGEIQLPAVTVHMEDGSTAVTTPRVLQVTSGDPSLVGDAVAKCAFEPPSIVPGQPTTLVYHLYLQRGNVSKLDIAPPDGSISLGERRIAEGRTIDTRGKSWTAVTVSWPITHAVPGTYSVGGQQEIQIALDDFGMRVKRKQIIVPHATLTVEALPVDGRPDDFSGLIGPLSAHATLERERLAAGEGTVLSVTVEGRQTDLAKRPPLRLIGAQCYAKDESGGNESRTFRWDIVPATPGTITIPPLHFPYFDPGSRSYRSVDTEALSLAVLPGRSRDLGIVGGAPIVPTQAPAAPAAPSMPAPLRGQTTARPESWLALAALAGGLGVGLSTALLRRLTIRRAPHRGRQLRAAGSDPIALTVALAALRPALSTTEQHAAADALQDAIDRHRFGGQHLPDPTPWVRALEDVA